MTDYNVEAELADDVDQARAHELLDEFAAFHPAIGWTPRGRADIVLTIPAPSFAGAFRIAEALLARLELGAVHIMSTDEWDRRTSDVPMPELVGAAEAAGIIGVTRQRVQQIAADGGLPSTRIGQALAFPRSAVEHYAQQAAQTAN